MTTCIAIFHNVHCLLSYLSILRQRGSPQCMGELVKDLWQRSLPIAKDNFYSKSSVQHYMHVLYWYQTLYNTIVSGIMLYVHLQMYTQSYTSLTWKGVHTYFIVCGLLPYEWSVRSYVNSYVHIALSLLVAANGRMNTARIMMLELPHQVFAEECV